MSPPTKGKGRRGRRRPRRGDQVLLGGGGRRPTGTSLALNPLFEDVAEEYLTGEYRRNPYPEYMWDRTPRPRARAVPRGGGGGSRMGAIGQRAYDLATNPQSRRRRFGGGTATFVDGGGGPPPGSPRGDRMPPLRSPRTPGPTPPPSPQPQPSPPTRPTPPAGPGGGGDEGGGMPQEFLDYLDEVQRVQEETRLANEDRYEEILEGYEEMGGQERADIRSRYAGLASRGQQDLISRGLVGTTVLPGMRSLWAREETGAVGRLEERLRGERLGFMERRQDTYADPSLMMNAAIQYGQGTGGTSRPPTEQPGTAPGRPVAIPGRGVGGGLMPSRGDANPYGPTGQPAPARLGGYPTKPPPGRMPPLISPGGAGGYQGVSVGGRPGQGPGPASVPTLGVGGLRPPPTYSGARTNPATGLTAGEALTQREGFARPPGVTPTGNRREDFFARREGNLAWRQANIAAQRRGDPEALRLYGASGRRTGSPQRAPRPSGPGVQGPVGPRSTLARPAYGQRRSLPRSGRRRFEQSNLAAGRRYMRMGTRLL